jgi:hypothetical protein
MCIDLLSLLGHALSQLSLEFGLVAVDHLDDSLTECLHLLILLLIVLHYLLLRLLVM